MESSVIEKLRKIKAHAESAKKIGNEAEAQAFTAMFQKLLLKHKLAMTDIEFEQDEAEEPVDEHEVNWASGGFKQVNSRVRWQELLAKVVAEAYFCDILVVPGSNRTILVGRKSDAEIAEYVLVTVARIAFKLSGIAWRTGERGTNFRQSWLEGFIMRLNERLREELNRTVAETVNSSMALVRVNKATLAVKNYLAKKFEKPTKAGALSGSRGFNHRAYQQGREAANKVDIRGNAMNSGAPAKGRASLGS